MSDDNVEEFVDVHNEELTIEEVENFHLEVRYTTDEEERIGENVSPS